MVFLTRGFVALLLSTQAYYGSCNKMLSVMDPDVIVNSLQPVAELAYNVEKVLKGLKIHSLYSDDEVMIKEAEEALTTIKALTSTSLNFPEILVEPEFLKTVASARNEADMVLTVLTSYIESTPLAEPSNSEGHRRRSSLHDKVRNLSLPAIHKLSEIKTMDIQERWTHGFEWYGYELRVVESSIPVDDRAENERYLINNWYHEDEKLWCTISMMPDTTDLQIEEFKSMMPFDMPSKEEPKGQQINRGYPGWRPAESGAQWQVWTPQREMEMEWVEKGIRVFVVGLWRSERAMVSVHPWVMGIDPFEPQFDVGMAFD